VPDHISLWGLRLAICQPLQQYANVRPTKILRGTQSPLRACAATAPPNTQSLSADQQQQEGQQEQPRPQQSLDWVIVRENSEGEYAGHGGRSHVGQPWETATEVSVFTRHGVERIMRFAYETARSRPRRRLTVVSKSNAQRNGMVLWDEIAREVGREFPDVETDKMLVDAMTCRMVLRPESIDTVVATNLVSLWPLPVSLSLFSEDDKLTCIRLPKHADILSDLAAALAGSIGIAPTSNLDPTRKNPSMFEPIHGSAFDITGKGVANPVGALWSSVEMLKWLGQGEAGDVLLEAVEAVCEKGVVTADLGGSARTDEVTSAVCEEIRARYSRR